MAALFMRFPGGKKKALTLSYDDGLVSDAAVGVNGNAMFVDGGTDALLNSEKVY